MKVQMYKWAKYLFPINRSLTGEGVRQTLNYIKKNVKPNLRIYKISSGKKIYDWRVPLEWKVTEALINDSKGKNVINFKKNNLHIVGYSTPVNKKIKFAELKKNLHYLKDLPNAIPYRTSYYRKTWGFCLSYNQFKKMDKNLIYKVKINSKLFKGKLNYGEIFIKGKLKKEILFSTNICHPSMGNNELSGPVLAMQLANLIYKKKRKFSYRIIFIPETIGAIIFLKKNIKTLKKNLLAGFVLSCVGDNKNFSKISSRLGNTLADRMLENIFKISNIKYKNYSFLERGSDERQFCSPGVDLPVCSFLRTKHGKFKEYHTSIDDLNFISKKGLLESFKILKKLIFEFEKLKFYKVKKKCEPFLTKYNLKKSLSGEKKMNFKTKSLIDTIAYCDGTNSLKDISKITNLKISILEKNIKILQRQKIISE